MDPQIYLLLALIIASGFFSGAEIALFSLTQGAIRSAINRKAKHAHKLELITKNRQRLLITILIGNNFINIGASSIATVVAIERFGSAGAGIATGIMTFLILFFGEIIPKSFGQQHAEKIALIISPWMRLIMIILTPFVEIMYWLTRAVQAVVGGNTMTPTVSEEELKAMVSIGHEEGQFEQDEKDMINKVFLLNDICAEDVMTPDEYIVGFTADTTLREAIPVMHESGYSRFPVYSQAADTDIQGVIYLKDVFVQISQEYAVGSNTSYEEVMSQRVSEVMKNAVYVPQTMLVDDLMKDFQKRHVHIAIVVDEHGATRGLVTLEDLLEEVVGEIVDETDVDAEMIQRIDKNTIIVNPRIAIGKVNTFFNANFPGARQKSMGWLVLKEFGNIPRKGDAVEINGYQCIVEEAEERRIKRLKIVRTAKARMKK